MNKFKEILAFDKKQKRDWALAAVNYKDLSSVKVRTFDVNGLDVKAQFNPKRINSAIAKVDKKSLSERPCFLCDKNRPPEQNSFPLANGYHLLVNPFPIFEPHFTIPKLKHEPQAILDNFEDMLLLCEEMEGLDLFYNGPWCGASAPDHFHFQAMISGSLPLFSEPLIKPSDGLIIQNVSVDSIQTGIYKCLALSAKNKKNIVATFHEIYHLLDIKNDEYEPRLNILARYANHEWKVLIVPREAHRPSHFSLSGKQQFRISPASVEVSGLLSLAFEDDFNRLNAQVINEIFSEVLLSDSDFEQLITKLKTF